MRTLSEHERDPKLGLRVIVEPGGCHGYVYKLELSSEYEEDDLYVVLIEELTSVCLWNPMPELFKSAVSDCYVIFGEVKSEDMSAFAQAQAAQMAQAQKSVSDDAGTASSAPSFNLNDLTSSKKVEDDEEEDENAPIDETGVDQKDIDLVMEQVSCSRRKAVKALKENDGDLINAIMSVS